MFCNQLRNTTLKVYCIRITNAYYVIQTNRIKLIKLEKYCIYKQSKKLLNNVMFLIFFV